MKKRDFETYQKRFRDFEILPKFSETHVFRGTIRHPSSGAKLYAEESFLLGIDWSVIYSTEQFLKWSMVQYISIFFLHITI